MNECQVETQRFTSITALIASRKNLDYLSLLLLLLLSYTMVTETYWEKPEDSIENTFGVVHISFILCQLQPIR